MDKSDRAITRPHDGFIKTLMSDPTVAREFFTLHLPAELLKITNLNHLVLQPNSYIDDVRKESVVDLLYQTKISGHIAYLYLLLEHQSTDDPLMPFRMLKYTCNVIDQHLQKTKGKKKKLPLVYPLVIYHGKDPYSYSTNIADIVDAPRALVEKYFLKPFHLIDLSKITDETLKEHARVGVMQFALKHIYAKDILPHLHDISAIMHRIANSGGEDYISIVLQYLLERGSIQNETEFFELVNEQISFNVGDKIMTLAERLEERGKIKGRQEGRQEGMQEGMQEGEQKGRLEVAQRLLLEGMKPEVVARITDLSLHTIERLQVVLPQTESVM